jgi:signal recognition particle subunit SRP68
MISPSTTTILPTHLEILLFESERAWAYAMEVKESSLSSKVHGGGRKQMFLSRLKKAAKHAEDLEALAGVPDVATDRTALEIVAYRGNMKGILAMERGDWVTAHREFKLSHALLVNLVRAPGATREEIEVLGDRARDLEPSIRYCKYNMQGGEGKETDNQEELLGTDCYKKLQKLLECKPEGDVVGDSKGDGEDSVVFRGSKISLSPPSVRLVFLRVKDTLKEFQEKGKVEGEEGERYYVKALTAVDDLLEGTEREIERLNNSNLTPAIESKIESQKLLAHYTTYMKLKCSCDRGEQIVSHLLAHPSTSPSEFVHLYDSLLQNAKEILTVGGGDSSDDFAVAANALVLRIRALRCRHVGAFYEATAQYQKAISVLGHAQNLATDAAEQYQALDDESEELKEMTELEEKVTGDKCRVTAKLYLASVGKNTGAVSKNLLQRLQKFDSAIDPSTGKVTVSSVNLLSSVYAKPTFFDIANNFVETPRLEEGAEEEEDEDEEGSEDEGVDAEEGNVGGGLLGWFRR